MPKETSGGNSPLRIPKMAELVSQRLRRQIVRGELSEGEALPSEAALMTRFGISRPTLREAFRVLESEGLISVRRGAHGGARVHMPNGDAAARYAGLVLQHRGTTLRDVHEARSIIEPPCAALLARRRTQADIKRLRTAIEEERAAPDEPSTLIRLHLEFHALVVELAGNQTLAVLSGMLDHIIDSSRFAHVAVDLGSAPNARAIRTGFRAHERLIEHVTAREPDDATQVWSTHLTEAERYLLGGSSPRTVLDVLG